MDDRGKLETGVLYCNAVPSLGYMHPSTNISDWNGFVTLNIGEPFLAIGEIEVNSLKETWCKVLHLKSQKTLWVLTFNPFWRANIRYFK